jgi:hypothetical protein
MVTKVGLFATADVSLRRTQGPEYDHAHPDRIPPGRSAFVAAPPVGAPAQALRSPVAGFGAWKDEVSSQGSPLQVGVEVVEPHIGLSDEPLLEREAHQTLTPPPRPD